MEIAAPRTDEEQRLLGDAWFDLGRHASGTDRLGAWSRARHWYELCVGSLTGINQQLVQKHQDELDKVLPVVITDWNAISDKQWQNLRAPTLEIDAHLDRSDTGVTMHGERVRAVACPSDTWSWSTGSDTLTCTAQGGRPTFPRPRGRRNNGGGNPTNLNVLEGQLTLQLDSGAVQPLGVVSGSGHLWVVPQNAWGLLGSGTIRIKLLPIEDPEDP